MARCLFSAPWEFIPGIETNTNNVVPTVFREVWLRDELTPDAELTAWIINPQQHFIADRAVFDLFPSLDVIVTPSTGRNHIDTDAASSRQIAVYSLLDDREGLDSISASAEFTFLLLLNTLRRLDVMLQEAPARGWQQVEGAVRGHELSGKTVGLVGLGRIGRRLSRYCAAFDAHVRYHDPYVSDPALPAVTLAELFDTSDVVCVCCTHTAETTGMLGRELLGRLKQGACLVNTSRGEVIREPDLAAVLTRRPDLRVGLDVLTGMASGDHRQSPLLPFHGKGQLVVTPHAAGAAVEAQSKAAAIAVRLLRAHLSERAAG